MNIELLNTLILDLLREKREEARSKLFNENNPEIRRELLTRIAILAELTDSLTLEINNKFLIKQENFNNAIR